MAQTDTETDLLRQASIQTIYSLLLKGNKLQLDFSSVKEAEVFRVSLAIFKRRQDLQLIDVGLMEEDDRQGVKFEKVGELEHTFVVSFVEKEARRQYSFKILDDNVVEEGN